MFVRLSALTLIVGSCSGAIGSGIRHTVVWKDGNESYRCTYSITQNIAGADSRSRCESVLPGKCMPDVPGDEPEPDSESVVRIPETLSTGSPEVFARYAWLSARIRRGDNSTGRGSSEPLGVVFSDHQGIWFAFGTDDINLVYAHVPVSEKSVITDLQGEAKYCTGSEADRDFQSCRGLIFRRYLAKSSVREAGNKLTNFGSRKLLLTGRTVRFRSLLKQTNDTLILAAAGEKACGPMGNGDDCLGMAYLAAINEALAFPVFYTSDSVPYEAMASAPTFFPSCRPAAN